MYPETSRIAAILLTTSINIRPGQTMWHRQFVTGVGLYSVVRVRTVIAITALTRTTEYKPIPLSRTVIIRYLQHFTSTTQRNPPLNGILIRAMSALFPVIIDTIHAPAIVWHRQLEIQQQTNSPLSSSFSRTLGVNNLSRRVACQQRQIPISKINSFKSQLVLISWTTFRCSMGEGRTRLTDVWRR